MTRTLKQSLMDGCNFSFSNAYQKGPKPRKENSYFHVYFFGSSSWWCAPLSKDIKVPSTLRVRTASFYAIPKLWNP